MGDIEKSSDIDMTSSSELTASLMEQLGKAFVELEAHKVASTDEIRWDNVEEHFHILESRLKKEHEELEAKEKVFAERRSSNNMVLAEREAAVIAKEQDMLYKLQELKDAAVASITEARANGENKAYLKELRRKCQGTGNAALQNDYNARELAAVRAVIECVENYKLEDAYPLDPLHRRVAQLDKFSRGGRKRTTSETTVKQPDQKKHQRPSGPRARGYGSGRRAPPPSRERVPYGYYGQQAGRQPRNLYITSAAAAPPSYGAYTQSPHYPYI